MTHAEKLVHEAVAEARRLGDDQAIVRLPTLTATFALAPGRTPEGTRVVSAYSADDGRTVVATLALLEVPRG